MGTILIYGKIIGSIKEEMLPLGALNLIQLTIRKSKIF
jgi:hypothetical protein